MKQFIEVYRADDETLGAALREVLAVAKDVSLTDGHEWRYDIERCTFGVCRFRLACLIADNFAPSYEPRWQFGRWWYLDATTLQDQGNEAESHIVRTFWLAYQTFMHHEMMENFRYVGGVVFNPHDRIGQAV